MQIEAMLAFCRQHLHDPELTPQRVADHARRFAEDRALALQADRPDLSAAGCWKSGSNACRTALRDENQRNLNISEIAYRWGFNDLSHFNKAFRTHFDQTPREWRNGSNVTMTDRRYSAIISPVPPNSVGKSFSFGRPSRIGSTVSA